MNYVVKAWMISKKAKKAWTYLILVLFLIYQASAQLINIFTETPSEILSLDPWFHHLWIFLLFDLHIPLPTVMEYLIQKLICYRIFEVTHGSWLPRFWKLNIELSKLFRECPLDLKEAISSVCFAAPRCADLPELLQVQMLFASKYGKEFVSAATELMPDCGVNRQVTQNFIWWCYLILNMIDHTYIFFQFLNCFMVSFLVFLI